MPPPSDPWGPPTRWSLVARAAGASGPEREQAWRELLERYRDPVERALRRRLAGHPDIEDRVLEFFAHLYQYRVLERVDPERGRFRQYVQGVLRNYVHEVRRRDQAGRREVPLPDSTLADAQAAGPEDVEHEELHLWAAAVLHNALESLRRDRPETASLLVEAYGLEGTAPVPREEQARQRGLEIGTLYVALNRARKELGRRILRELREQVSDAGELADEARLIQECLFEAFPGLRG